MGGELDFEDPKGYPFLQNDPEMTARATEAAKAYLGRITYLT